MLEGNFNVTRVRAVPRPLNIHIILVQTLTHKMQLTRLPEKVAISG